MKLFLITLSLVVALGVVSQPLTLNDVVWSTARVVGSSNTGPCGTNGPVLLDATMGTQGPWPWYLDVSGVAGPVTAVTVTLTNFNHNFPSDLHWLLVSPNGLAVKFYGAAGGSTATANITVTLDDAAGSYLPDPMITGVFKPTDTDPTYVFPAGPPIGPYATNFSSFIGMAAVDANGYWKVYAADAVALDGGAISNVCVSISY